MRLVCYIIRITFPTTSESIHESETNIPKKRNRFCKGKQLIWANEGQNQDASLEMRQCSLRSCPTAVCQ